MDSTIQHYLNDVLRLLIERAKEAKQESKDLMLGVREEAFQQGRAMAYYEVISTLVNQASVFGLSKDQIPELDFDPDKELLS